MNTDIVQQLRYKLEKRFRKTNSAGYQTIHFSLLRFWQFLHSNEVFVGVLQQLANLDITGKANAQSVLNEEQQLYGRTEDAEACLAYWVIKGCIESDESKHLEINIATLYTLGSTHNENLEHFKDTFLEPLYDYIDEQLDDQRAVLGLLRRYKHNCEWFRRDDVFRIYDAETNRSHVAGMKSRGEHQLALHLYVVSPSSVNWASFPLPTWFRWLGIVIGILCSILMYRTLSSLGKNLTDTVVTRTEATLVTHGPYRWVRHPFYVTTALLMASVTVLAANWLIGAGSVLVLSLLAVRTPKEERMLIERFGQQYRDYMAKTGRFLPRF